MVFHELLHDNWNITSWFFERLTFFTRFSVWIWFWLLFWVTLIIWFVLSISKIIEVIFLLEFFISKRLSFMLEFWVCIGVDHFLELILESWTLGKVRHVLLLSVVLVTYFDHKRAWIILWFIFKFFLLRVDLNFLAQSSWRPAWCICMLLKRVRQPTRVVYWFVSLFNLLDDFIFLFVTWYLEISFLLTSHWLSVGLFRLFNFGQI